MVPITSLLVPVLLSAVMVFVASAIIHMVLTYHRSDFRAVPGQDEVMASLRKLSISPGDYEIPHAATPKERNSPEFIEKQKQGPNALLTVAGGPPAMGKLLAQWFLYCVLVGIFAAYIAGRALQPGADYLAVFRFVGGTAFVGYSLALIQDSIWYARPWSTTWKSMFDGLVYAALTAGTFGWLWPE